MARKFKFTSIDVFIRRQPRTVLLLGGLLLIYIAYLLGNAFWGNYQINKQIKDLQIAIAKIETDNRSLQNYIAYYKTDAYREKALRQKLGFQKSGETVIATPKDNPVAKRVVKTEEEKIQGNLTNWQKWFVYFTE